MPKLTIKRWTEPGTTVQRVSYTVSPTCSWRYVNAMKKALPRNAEGTFWFKFIGDGKVMRQDA